MRDETRTILVKTVVGVRLPSREARKFRLGFLAGVLLAVGSISMGMGVLGEDLWLAASKATWTPWWFDLTLGTLGLVGCGYLIHQGRK